MRGRHRLTETLALEQHLERNERINSQGAVSVDPAVAAAPRDHDLGKSGFAEDPLTKAFEAGCRQFEENIRDGSPMVVGRRTSRSSDNLFGGLALAILR